MTICTKVLSRTKVIPCIFLVGTLAANAAVAECVTRADVESHGVWTTYEGGRAVHSKRTPDGKLHETEFYSSGKPNSISVSIDGLAYLEYWEFAEAAAKPTLISSVEFVGPVKLDFSPNGETNLTGTRHLTDAALSDQDASTGEIHQTIKVTGQTNLSVGDCSYDAVETTHEIHSEHPTNHGENYILTDLGIKIFRTAGFGPVPKLVSLRAAALSVSPPEHVQIPAILD